MVKEIEKEKEKNFLKQKDMENMEKAFFPPKKMKNLLLILYYYLKVNI